MVSQSDFELGLRFGRNLTWATGGELGGAAWRGDHAIFGGRERRMGGAKGAEFQRLTGQSSLAFWDADLRDDARAKEWLTTQFKMPAARKASWK